MESSENDHEGRSYEENFSGDRYKQIVVNCGLELIY